ncbi:uncharacterized protein M421DRAFT_423714 [Didymella exigua CBS 183.55]|uniref:Uncharacterized protein n=1 Tax=Didymella exigua CBS 183.55 TaxID=1150837 RepID=A0A6A5RD31_9PLEO|nr:uncharacterized protein M421DRAFT_423714 [Didymella exigua CBS 183.55]KAF1925383.1 hypothetical protein M421DRAFT_423714 [Didymella exigua CBS 183.55]
MPLEEALAELNTLGPTKDFLYRKLAKKHSYCYIILICRHKGKCALRKAKAEY